jgi:hypothetical protein
MTIANFCNKCGASLTQGPFCVKCGADARQTSSSITQTSPSPTPAQFQMQSSPQPVAPKSTSPLMKIALVVLILFMVGGVMAAAGVYYVAHRVSQKVHEVEGSLSAVSTSTDSRSGDSKLGDSKQSSAIAVADVCRLLSKDEVTKAIGVEIVSAETADGGCSYMAVGDQADMTSKHMAAMLASKGADAKTQKMAQAFSGALFKSMQEQAPKKTNDAEQKVSVLSIGVDADSGGTQMELSKRTIGALGPASPGLSGIGDDAMDTGNSMMMIRKGDKLIRIMYMTCPCGTDSIKPLAKLLADRV